jgi:actin-like ATPase involved in cell morphogenesis
METLLKPPELADITIQVFHRGGGSMLRGLDKEFQKTDLPVYIAEDPLQ